MAHRRSGNEQVMIVLGGNDSGKYGSLAKTIQDELMAVGTVVDDNVQAIFDDVGKEVFTYILSFFGFLSHLGHHRTLSRVP